jgi:hypothetical protein
VHSLLASRESLRFKRDKQAVVVREERVLPLVKGWGEKAKVEKLEQTARVRGKNRDESRQQDSESRDQVQADIKEEKIRRE